MKLTSTTHFAINWPGVCIGCGKEDAWDLEEFKQFKSIRVKRTNQYYSTELATQLYMCAQCKSQAQTVLTKAKTNNMRTALIAVIIGFFGIVIVNLPTWYSWSSIGFFMAAVGFYVAIEYVYRGYYFGNIQEPDAFYRFDFKAFGRNKQIIYFSNRVYGEKFRSSNPSGIDVKIINKAPVPPDALINKL